MSNLNKQFEDLSNTPGAISLPMYGSSIDINRQAKLPSETFTDEELDFGNPGNTYSESIKAHVENGIFSTRPLDQVPERIRAEVEKARNKLNLEQ